MFSHEISLQSYNYTYLCLRGVCDGRTRRQGRTRNDFRNMFHKSNVRKWQPQYCAGHKEAAKCWKVAVHQGDFSCCLDSQAILKKPHESSQRHRFAFKGESFLCRLHSVPTMQPFHSPRDVSCASHLVLALLHNYLLNSLTSKPSNN